MASKGKGGHVRGAVIPLVGGLLVINALTLTLVNAQPMGLNLVATPNPATLGGTVWVYQAINGGDWSRIGIITQGSFTGFAGTQVGAARTTGQTVSCYCEYRSSNSELVIRTNTAIQVVP